MGTSKAYGGPKGNPTWSSLSSTITKAVNDGHPTSSSLAGVMSHLVSYLGAPDQHLLAPLKQVEKLV